MVKAGSVEESTRKGKLSILDVEGKNQVPDLLQNLSQWTDSSSFEIKYYIHESNAKSN